MQNEANETIFANWIDFIKRETEKILDKNLEGKAYDSLKSKERNEQMCQEVLEKLAATNKNFKFIVTCILLDAQNHGMDVSGMCLWDAQMDGTVCVKWDSKLLTCVMQIYGVAK